MLTYRVRTLFFTKEMIEKKVAETILEKPLTVFVGNTSYEVAPPSVGTLIMVSEAVSRLPHTKLDADNVLEECLSVGRDCTELGEIAAILILGAKKCRQSVGRRLVSGGRYFYGLIDTRRWKETNAVEELTREVLENCSPRQIFDIITRILGTLELSDFFALTTFLSGVNLLRPTKVEKEAIASGHSSQV